jgi:hypothetical protein
MSPVVSVLGLQKMGLVFQVGSLVLSLTAMVVLGGICGSIAAIAGFSVVKTLSIIIYRLHMFTLLGVSPRSMALSIGMQTIGYVAAFALAERLFSQAAATQSSLLYAASAAALLGAVTFYAANAVRAARRLNALRSPPGRRSADQGLSDSEA